MRSPALGRADDHHADGYGVHSHAIARLGSATVLIGDSDRFG